MRLPGYAWNFTYPDFPGFSLSEPHGVALKLPRPEDAIAPAIGSCDCLQEILGDADVANEYRDTPGSDLEPGSEAGRLGYVPFWVITMKQCLDGW
jgi:hypothetical protein